MLLEEAATALDNMDKVPQHFLFTGRMLTVDALIFGGCNISIVSCGRCTQVCFVAAQKNAGCTGLSRFVVGAIGFEVGLKLIEAGRLAEVWMRQ